MYNIRMSDRRHNLHFPPNAYEISLGLDLAFLDSFDGDLLACLLVDAQLHLSVRALT